MPNWCMNEATFEHDDEHMLHQLVAAFNSGHTMQAFQPCPQELRNTFAGSFGNDASKQTALENKQRENIAKYGAKDWYDWCCDNWGVKWDFGRDHHAGDPAAEVQTKNGKKYVQLSFSTAWAPPNGFYNFIHEQLGFRVKAYFYEPGMGFVGSSKNGIENTINIREMTEEWLADNVPAKICNIFNLFEQAAQMEADEKEFNQREKTDTQS